MGTYSVELPLDDDGFLRRECPHCLRQFKWHHGPTATRPEGEADPAAYYCPLCGASAVPDQWWIQEQATFIQASAAGPALREMSDELEKAFKGIKGLTYKPGRLDDEPEPPAALHEPNDMVILAPPCHPWEPVKVPEEATARAHCLICGAAFAA